MVNLKLKQLMAGTTTHMLRAPVRQLSAGSVTQDR